MVAKVARLHFQPANPAGALRALAGWLIALTGCAVLLTQVVSGLEGFALPVSSALSGGAMAAIATALGAAPLLVMRRISAGAQGALLGFGAGVMLAASVFSLLLPAFEAAQAQGMAQTGAATLAAIGLAVGAIGTAIASVVTGFMGLVWWQMPLAVLGLLLVISGPSMVIAYMKLRSRTLAPILDANGWAVNTRATINIPFGASLTGLAELPPGAQRSLRDPFAQRKTPWKTYIFLAVLIAVLGELWYLGVLQKAWHDVKARATPVATQPAAAKPEGPAKAEAAKVEGAAKPEAALVPPAKAPAQ